MAVLMLTEVMEDGYDGERLIEAETPAVMVKIFSPLR